MKFALKHILFPCIQLLCYVVLVTRIHNFVILYGHHLALCTMIDHLVLLHCLKLLVSLTITLQWDDSIDNLPEESADHASRLRLPTPKRRLVSPLKKYETPKISKRRKVKKWSILEEDTLRTGVQKYVLFSFPFLYSRYVFLTMKEQSYFVVL